MIAARWFGLLLGAIVAMVILYAGQVELGGPVAFLVVSVAGTVGYLVGASAEGAV